MGKSVRNGGDAAAGRGTIGENEDVWTEPQPGKTKGAMLGMRKCFAYERCGRRQRGTDLLFAGKYLIPSIDEPPWVIAETKPQRRFAR